MPSREQWSCQPTQSLLGQAWGNGILPRISCAVDPAAQCKVSFDESVTGLGPVRGSKRSEDGSGHSTFFSSLKSELIHQSSHEVDGRLVWARYQSVAVPRGPVPRGWHLGEIHPGRCRRAFGTWRGRRSVDSARQSFLTTRAEPRHASGSTRAVAPPVLAGHASNTPSNVQLSTLDLRDLGTPSVPRGQNLGLDQVDKTSFSCANADDVMLASDFEPESEANFFQIFSERRQFDCKGVRVTVAGEVNCQGRSWNSEGPEPSSVIGRSRIRSAPRIQHVAQGVEKAQHSVNVSPFPEHSFQIINGLRIRLRTRRGAQRQLLLRRDFQ